MVISREKTARIMERKMKSLERNLETEGWMRKMLTDLWVLHNKKLDNLKRTQEKLVGLG